MEGEGQKSHCPFTSVMALDKLGATHVPQYYVLPPSQRPNPGLNASTTLPIVDLSSLQDPSLMSHTIDEIRKAYFQVINHGIAPFVMKDALDAATDFFNLSIGEKMLLVSDNVHEQKEVEKGSQVMAVNCYPACPEPVLALGMPPHSDYGSLTILLQSCPGLQFMDQNKNWSSVPAVEGALIVQLGDQIEVMSNGLYKSVVHQVKITIEKHMTVTCRSLLPLKGFAEETKGVDFL